MKRTVLIAAALLTGMAASAQTLSLTDGKISYYYPASDMVMPFGAGNTVTIGDKTFSLETFSSLAVGETCPVEKNSVLVSYEGETAKVAIHGSVADYVEVEMKGAHVTITQSADVSESTCGEITYILEGQSDNGSLTLNGSYKSSIDLNGVVLVNPTGAAIDIQNGKRIELSAKNGTVNRLTDGSGSQKAALYCKGHLELKGKGSLEVKGNQGHAISAKEYITVKNLTLNITGTVKDGINCNQYFTMESGNVTIADTGDDGIQVSFKDDTDREAEDTGTLTIKGGKLNVNIAKGAASKGIKADGDVVIEDGEIEIQSSCNGTWDDTKVKTKASACIGADGNVNIAGGTLRLTASGSGGKGISCDGIFTSDGGDITIKSSGGLLVYSNGTLNHNYTGNVDRIDSDYKSSAKGIKADGGIVINNGKFNVTTSSNNAEGIESKALFTINGGDIFVKAYDDGFNSSSDMRINGGIMKVMSSVGDAIDSNANLYITGGTVIALGAGGAEQGLDAADESRCAVYITGGNVLCYGGRNAPVSQTTGSQAFVTVSGSLTANATVAVKSGSEEMVSFVIPAEYTASSGSTPWMAAEKAPGGGGWNPGSGGGFGGGNIMISCPGLKSGSSYTVANGSSTSTATAKYTSSSF